MHSFIGRQSRIKCLNHVHGKIWPLRIQSWLGMLGLSSILRVTFLGHPFVRRQCCLFKMSQTMNKMQVGSSIPKRMDNGVMVSPHSFITGEIMSLDMAVILDLKQPKIGA